MRRPRWPSGRVGFRTTSTSPASTRTWGGGIAFLDHEHISPAPTLGHAYLVTAEQFEDVAAQETGREHAEVQVAEVRAAGSVTLGTGRYDHIVWLGDVDGFPS